jgi:hypothetical protein
VIVTNVIAHYLPHAHAVALPPRAILSSAMRVRHATGIELLGAHGSWFNAPVVSSFADGVSVNATLAMATVSTHCAGHTPRAYHPAPLFQRTTPTTTSVYHLQPLTTNPPQTS